MAPGEDTDPTSLPNRFAGTQTDPVPDGGILTVYYTDPDQAGQTVQVVATDRDDPTESQQLEVVLRGNGKGSVLLTVPVGWAGVVLSNERSRKRTVDVAVPP